MTAPLFMVHLPLDERRLGLFAAAQRRLDDDEGYLFHAVLAALFGPDAPKPFTVTAQPGGGRAILAYARLDQPALSELARLQAPPEAYAVIDWTGAASKPMPAAFHVDQVLAFTVRVLPTVRTGKHHPVFRPGAEVDAFLAQAESNRDAPKPDRDTVYLAWLEARCVDSGAALVAARITGRRRRTLVRKAADGTRQALRQHPDLDIAGTLVVRNPDLFRAFLARGLGRHRAFGFGMLLLRPGRC